MASIRTAGLTKDFGDLRAVNEIDLDLPEGGVAGFVGPNGAGKSTTIRMLLGLITPTSGQGEVLGHPIDRPATYLHRVGALIEAPAFYPTLTGAENLQVFARLGGHDRGRIPRLLDVVGLRERGRDRYSNYSLGMKQRLGIALALLPDPDLLILDEPTNGLDPQGIVEIRSLLMRLGARGKTVFVSSHLLAEIQAACDSIVMIDHGGVIFAGFAPALDTPPVPVQMKLAACWASFMFLYVYVDILGLYMPGVIDDILAGVVWEFEISQAWAIGALTLMAIPILMIVLSVILPARPNRVVNLVVASLYIVVSAGVAIGESWTYYFALAIGLELTVLVLIIRSAWAWPRTRPVSVRTAEAGDLPQVLV